MFGPIDSWMMMHVSRSMRPVSYAVKLGGLTAVLQGSLQSGLRICVSLPATGTREIDARTSLPT